MEKPLINTLTKSRYVHFYEEFMSDERIYAIIRDKWICN